MWSKLRDSSFEPSKLTGAQVCFEIESETLLLTFFVLELGDHFSFSTVSLVFVLNKNNNIKIGLPKE